MSCNLSCGCTNPTGLISTENKKAKQFKQMLADLQSRLGNKNVDCIFTFFWNTVSDLDIWVYHNSGEYVSYTKTKNTALGLELDVDANAGNQRITNPIENISVLSSNSSPDGVYSVYLDDFNNRDNNNYFNFVTGYKEVGTEQSFTNIIWLKNKVPFVQARGNGNKNSMLHVIDITKTGRKFKVTWIIDSLEVVLNNKYLIET